MKYREPEITSPYIFRGWDFPSSAHVEVKYMEGLGLYIKWIDCPNGENILAAGFTTKSQAEEWARTHNWTVCKRARTWVQPTMI